MSELDYQQVGVEAGKDKPDGQWCLLSSSPNGRTDDQLRDLYGAAAVWDRHGTFTLVHLDNPSAEERAKRITEFDPDELFEDDCPLCQMLKAEHCDVIYDQGDTDEA